MTSIVTNDWGNAILQRYLRDETVYLGLHDSNPGVLGDTGTEIAGNGYTRQLVTWTDPGNKTVANAAQLEFLQMPDCTVAFYGVWTLLAGGSLLCAVQRGGAVPDPMVVASNQKFVIPAMDLVITL